MPDEIRRVQYVYLLVKDQAGEGAQVLAALKSAGINLLAFTGFPAKAGRAQIDVVAEDLEGVKRVAKANQWKLSPVKRAFLVSGEDRVGAVADWFGQLAAAKINVVAANAVSAGGGRYGVIFWVKPRAYERAAKILGAL
ncbi:MAG: hypothetical protein HY717_12425 [Planctomycetes bacterium]|nr:hypothetical protein [Planctomycetota bacterium]